MRKNLAQDIKKIQEKSFVDLPDTKPSVEYPLELVGVTNRPHYISIADPFDTSRQIRVFARITVLLSLVEQRKGLHMSRIERCFHELETMPDLTLSEYTKRLCQSAKEKQPDDTHTCKVIIEADYEKDTDKNISNKPSHELLKLHSEYEINSEGESFGVGLTAQIINACPCTQRWGMRDFYEFLSSKDLSEEEKLEFVRNAPLQAHTNRGALRLFIEDKNVELKEIYGIIDNGVPMIRELLASEDEHIVVKRAHEEGYYCEDVAREVVSQVYEFGKNRLEPDSRVKIEAAIDESIHFHNLYCKIDSSMQEITAAFEIAQ